MSVETINFTKQPHLLQAVPQVSSINIGEHSELLRPIANKADLKKAEKAEQDANNALLLEEQDLQKLSKELNREMKRIHSNLVFKYNEEIGSLVVVVKDSKGEHIIREIPPQGMVRLMEKMRDIVGIIFDKKG
ncbi:putative FLAGELLIN PROTEIN [Helicobacter bizzozeronii CIII-1]|uniref:Putative FLAGELLIN PROTEIN n=1 Tax=Helicobacter bizzozeronii (strain CIII-1) TaxID=1002804 RepID=F8KTH2_HELBC|nr:flagellar protein FlaG [Helicobacter bizzozeronii]CCB80130.1 putative FLAGELLIN PROTEIN [Helicobacter bizzozeronii CIII-1]